MSGSVSSSQPDDGHVENETDSEIDSDPDTDSGEKVNKRVSTDHDLTLSKKTRFDKTKSVCSDVRIPMEQALWHARFAHTSYKRIARVIKDKRIKGVEVNLRKWIEADSLDCNPCSQAKMTKVPLTKVSDNSRARLPNQRMHVDVNGPIKPLELHGEMYTLDVVDEATTLAWLYPLKLREQVYTVLSTHINRVEREFEHKVRLVKYLRSDNGAEFVSTKMEEFLDNKGIKHERPPGE